MYKIGELQASSENLKYHAIHTKQLLHFILFYGHVTLSRIFCGLKLLLLITLSFNSTGSSVGESYLVYHFTSYSSSYEEYTVIL